MELLCAICNEQTIRRGYYCNKCYKTYEKDILAGEEWIKVCKSFEIKRRRKKELPVIYLGDVWDVDDNNRLVYRN